MFNTFHLYAFPSVVKSWIYANGTEIKLFIISSSRISKVLNHNFLLIKGGSGEGWVGVFGQEMGSGLHSCPVVHDTARKANKLKSHKTNSQPRHTPE